MGWSTFIFLICSMFPISLADNSFVKPDDTGVAIQQIHECLPSCSSTEVELPSLGRPNPTGQSSFSTDTALIISGQPPPDNSDASSAIVHQALPCLTNGEEVIGEPPIRDLPRLSTSVPASSGSGTTHGGLSHHVIDINQQQSGQASTGTETSTRTGYPTRGFSEPSTSYSFSLPLLFATNSSSVHPRFLFRDSLLPQNSETYRAINIELQRTQPLTRHLPDDPHVISSHEVARDQPFKLGKTFLGLTFQAVLALMIFHFQGSSSSPSPSSPSSPPPSRTPSIPVEIVGASMAVGFTFTLIGILLRNPYPTVANISEYAGIFSAAFGFFVMTEMFLPENFSWTVWPTGVVLLLVFAFVLARMR